MIMKTTPAQFFSINVRETKRMYTSYAHDNFCVNQFLLFEIVVVLNNSFRNSTCLQICF